MDWREAGPGKKTNRVRPVVDDDSFPALEVFTMAAHAVLLSLAMSFAPAAPAPSGANPPTEDGAKLAASGGKDRHVIYEDDEISGETLSPNGTGVRGQIGIDHANMITIRGVFTEHMIRLSHDI